MTMTLVETIEVGAGGAASIEFTSIPQDADDLLLVVSARTNSDTFLRVYLNGDTTSSNYSARYLRGNGTSASSSTRNDSVIAFVNVNSDTANTFTSTSAYISNYAGSASKSLSIDSTEENNSSDANALLWTTQWTGTSAITSITLSNTQFLQYSTASLYKITKA